MRDDLAAQIGRLAAQIERLRRAVIALDPVPATPSDRAAFAAALLDADPTLAPCVAWAMATRAARPEMRA
jgi:hypothetical protein